MSYIVENVIILVKSLARGPSQVCLLRIFQEDRITFDKREPVTPGEWFNKRREQVSLAASAHEKIAGSGPLPQKMVVMPGAASKGCS